MAFHGSRDGSRGRGFGLGNFRGRGGSRGGNRGGIMGSSRGRGGGLRGRGRGRGKPIFDSARVAQKDEEKAEDSESQSPPESEDLEDDETSDEEDAEPIPTVSAYEALLKSFAASNPPPAKRRKLEQVEEAEIGQSNDNNSGVEASDSVEEIEEEPEAASIDQLEEEDEEVEDGSDPFENHFASPDEDLLSKRLKAIQKSQWTPPHRISIPKIGQAIISLPQVGDDKPSTLPSVSAPDEMKLKKKLLDVFVEQRPVFDNLENLIAPIILGYQDLLFCERALSNQESLRRLVCLHAVNHVFKTRDRVIKNNGRLAKDDENGDLEFKDQGFTRPKVLMILPTKESCVRMVNMITSLCEPDQQENRKRFDDTYVMKEEVFSASKPEDFRDLFAGNDEDLFRLGLKFTRRTIRYFSQFYNSDIIFCSPLGLRFAIEGSKEKKGDYDFLSSIEMVIVDQADALIMQNWEHVEYIFEHLNLEPKEAHGCDFSRVRTWYLDQKAKNFRQTITLSAFNTPDINSLLFNRSRNWAGKIKINAIYPGLIHQHVLGVRAKQTFSRFNSPEMIKDPDARFDYFIKAIVPTLSRRAKDTAGTIIYIPSSFDFVRIQKYFAEETQLTFGSIYEHTELKEIARARSHFSTGRHSVLLYTERAHHFHRYQLRGVKKVVMYGLPENPMFYKEIAGEYLSKCVQEGKLGREEGSVRVLFSRWDRLKLERIAGTERVGRMIAEKGDTFDFL